MEIAAAGDVQDLAAAADREHRQVSLERRLEQGELRPVSLRHDAFGLGVRVLAVRLRVEIRAAREKQAVERVERLVDGLLGGRDQEWAPAGSLDGPHVGGRHGPKQRREALAPLSGLFWISPGRAPYAAVEPARRPP